MLGGVGGAVSNGRPYPDLARPARRDKVLDEVSAAIPGDASRRERLASPAAKSRARNERRFLLSELSALLDEAATRQATPGKRLPS
jgi:hypothetical protein